MAFRSLNRQYNKMTMDNGIHTLNSNEVTTPLMHPMPRYFCYFPRRTQNWAVFIPCSQLRPLLLQRNPALCTALRLQLRILPCVEGRTCSPASSPQAYTSGIKCSDVRGTGQGKTELPSESSSGNRQRPRTQIHSTSEVSNLLNFLLRSSEFILLA